MIRRSKKGETDIFQNSPKGRDQQQKQQDVKWEIRGKETRARVGGAEVFRIFKRYYSVGYYSVGF